MLDTNRVELMLDTKHVSFERKLFGMTLILHMKYETVAVVAEILCLQETLRQGRLCRGRLCL